MVTLELRDPVAGVLARSYRSEDCQQFLHCCIADKQRRAAELYGLDPFAMAALTAEADRLLTILRLLQGEDVYATTAQAQGQDGARAAQVGGAVG
jgi:hypothetical protein